MKGVNKRVIEINEPDSEYIEKVLVFLRQKGRTGQRCPRPAGGRGVCQHTCVLAPSAAAFYPRRNGLLPGQWGWRGWCGCS